MKTDIVIGYKFSKHYKEQLKIANSSELNGWYNYNTLNSTINVTSDDFKNKKTFNSFVRHFSKIACHEAIHYAIHMITGEDGANATEEKFVELMTGERKW